VRIDYLCAGRYEPSRSLGLIREEDILEWAGAIEKTSDGFLLKFSSENILVSLSPSGATMRGERGTYGLVLAAKISENSFLEVATSAPPDTAEGVVLLVESDGTVEKAALCRKHPKPLVGELLENLAGLPRYLEGVFRSSGDLVKIVRVNHALLTP
jgi:hypothetical protein